MYQPTYCSDSKETKRKCFCLPKYHDMVDKTFLFKGRTNKRNFFPTILNMWCALHGKLMVH